MTEEERDALIKDALRWREVFPSDAPARDIIQALVDEIRALAALAALETT